MHDTQSELEPSPFLLTVGQASTVMQLHRCRHTSNRKVQRMCRDGAIACQKITTTRQGNPITEWLVDEASLLRYIEENEPKWDGTPPEVHDVAAGDGRAHLSHSGDANERTETSFPKDNQCNAMTPPKLERGATGDASIYEASANQGAKAGDDRATPDPDGDATDQVGETRRLADVLIDNAKLTAELAGARTLIDAITDEKGFLREELREARAGRKDVTAIAQRMLETLETIAVGGKLMAVPPREENEGRRSAPTPPSSAGKQSSSESGVVDALPNHEEQIRDAEPQPFWKPPAYNPPAHGDNPTDTRDDLRI